MGVGRGRGGLSELLLSTHMLQPWKYPADLHDFYESSIGGQAEPSQLSSHHFHDFPLALFFASLHLVILHFMTCI